MNRLWEFLGDAADLFIPEKGYLTRLLEQRNENVEGTMLNPIKWDGDFSLIV
jgi:hypothetical protein